MIASKLDQVVNLDLQEELKAFSRGDNLITLTILDLTAFDNSREGLEGLISSLFNPKIQRRGIARQRSRVSEKRRKSKRDWYSLAPGSRANTISRKLILPSLSGSTVVTNEVLTVLLGSSLVGDNGSTRVSLMQTFMNTLELLPSAALKNETVYFSKS